MILGSALRAMKLNENISYVRGSLKFLDKLIILEKELFGIDAYSIREMRALIKNSDFFIIALDRETPIGYICGMIENNVGHLKSLGVKKEYRKKGIGSNLLNMFEHFLAEKGVKKVFLEVSEKNTHAIAFYTRKGYYRVDKKIRFYEDGSDAYILEKILY